MHHTIVRSQQSQAEELDSAKARIRALEAQLRRIGVEPTTESAYADPAQQAQGGEQPAAHSFTSGNNHITIQPGAGSPSAAAMTAGMATTKVQKKKLGAQQDAQQQSSAAPAADDSKVRFALIEIDK